jgi:hypothetical protein
MIERELASLQRRLDRAESSVHLFKENERLYEKVKFLENLCAEKQGKIQDLELKVAQQGLRIGELLKEKNNGNG